MATAQTPLLDPIDELVDLEDRVMRLERTVRSIDPQLAALPPGSISGGIIAPGTLNGDVILDGTMDATKIITGSVDTQQLKAGAITTDKIAIGGVNGTNIAGGAITTDKIGANQITTGTMAAGAITSTEIATDTITAGNIHAGAITADELAIDSVTTGKIAADAITSREIQAGSIQAGDIATGSLTATQIQAGSITGDRITGGTITGDRMVSGTITATQIDTGTITSDRLYSGAINTNLIQAGNLATGSVTASKITVTSLSAISADLGFISAGTITGATIQTSSINPRIYLDSRYFRGVDSTGAITFEIDGFTGAAKFKGLVQSGATGLGNFADAITNAQFNNNTISGAVISDNTLAANKILANSITALQLNILPGGGNLLYNSHFDQALAGYWNTVGSCTVAQDTAHLFYGTKSAMLTYTGAAPGQIELTGYPQRNLLGIIGSMKYVWSAYLWPVNGRYGQLFIEWYDANDNYISQSGGTNFLMTANAWNTLTASATAPANAARAACVIYVYGVPQNESVWVGAAQMEQGDILTTYAPRVDEILPGFISGTMIQNGAVATAHMLANAIDASVITTGTMVADKIKTSSLTSSTITLLGGALQALGTSAAKVTFDQNGIKAYNAAGTNTVSINNDGSASFTGTVTAGAGNIGGWNINTSSITGATGTIETSASGNRVVIDGVNDRISIFDATPTERLRLDATGMIIKNSAGSPVFSTDGSGNLLITAQITAASGSIGGWSIGATDITGSAAGVIQTSPTGSARIVIDGPNDRFSAWDAQATPVERVRLDGTGITIKNAAGTAVLTSDGSGNLSVTGAITATSGSFTGTITAASGSIGSWTISSTDITGGTTGVIQTSPSGSARVVIDGPNDRFSAFDSAAVERVRLDGAGIVIKNAAGTAVISTDGSGNLTVTGAITATSGTFSGTINASGGTFTGTITATGTISGGTISGATITGTTITGTTVLGGVVKTADTPNARVELYSGTNDLRVYNSSNQPTTILDSGLGLRIVAGTYAGGKNYLTAAYEGLKWYSDTGYGTLIAQIQAYIDSGGNRFLDSDVLNSNQNTVLSRKVAGTGMGTAGTYHQIYAGSNFNSAQLQVDGGANVVATVASGFGNYTTQLLTPAGNMSVAGQVQVMNGQSLGTTLGDEKRGFQSYVATSNQSYLFITPYRNTAGGTSWSTAPYIMQAQTDATRQGYITWLGSSLGVSTVTPGYTWDVNGTVHYSTLTASSDERMKENIETVEDGLEKIMALRPVRFDWRDEYRHVDVDTELSERQLGLIAQEVAPVLPEIISSWEDYHRNPDSDHFGIPTGEIRHGISYERIIPVIISAMQAQQKKIEELEALVNA